jgi:MFS family permease
MYLLSFAAMQVPVGVLLDRYGPRRVVASLLCIAELGALGFALAGSFGELALGRALIGLGVSACLMGSIKAFRLWFPLARLATLNGWMIAFDGLDGLAATSPLEALLTPLGWLRSAAAALGVKIEVRHEFAACIRLGARKSK